MICCRLCWVCAGQSTFSCASSGTVWPGWVCQWLVGALDDCRYWICFDLAFGSSVFVCAGYQGFSVFHFPSPFAQTLILHPCIRYFCSAFPVFSFQPFREDCAGLRGSVRRNSHEVIETKHSDASLQH